MIRQEETTIVSSLQTATERVVIMALGCGCVQGFSTTTTGWQCVASRTSNHCMWMNFRHWLVHWLTREEVEYCSRKVMHTSAAFATGVRLHNPGCDWRLASLWYVLKRVVTGSTCLIANTSVFLSFYRWWSTGSQWRYTMCHCGNVRLCHGGANNDEWRTSRAAKNNHDGTVGFHCQWFL